jgi:hypothetical protein
MALNLNCHITFGESLPFCWGCVMGTSYGLVETAKLKLTWGSTVFPTWGAEWFLCCSWMTALYNIKRSVEFIRYKFKISQHCQSQWPCGLMHELPSPTLMLGLWVQIPLEEWMFDNFFIDNCSSFFITLISSRDDVLQPVLCCYFKVSRLFSASIFIHLWEIETCLQRDFIL